MERSVFVKEVNTQSLQGFELGTQEINNPICINIGFQRRGRQKSQNFHNDTFYRPLVTSGQCIIGTKKYTDSAILLIPDDDDYCHGYGQLMKLSKF